MPSDACAKAIRTADDPCWSTSGTWTSSPRPGSPALEFIPLPEFAARFEELPRDRPLFLFCRSGSRSAAATTHLISLGWTDVSNVDGGLLAWSRASLPLVEGPLEPGEGS